MHLDTVFTQIDRDKFTIHPGIMGPLTVFEIKSGRQRRHQGPRDQQELEEILEAYIGQPVELIPCGGGDRIAAEREQWNDGSNTLCVRPGTVVVYQRNNVTNKLLREKQGLNVIEMPLRRAVPRPWRPALHVDAAWRAPTSKAPAPLPAA